MSVARAAAQLVEIAAGAEALPDYERATIELLRANVGFDVAMFKRGGHPGPYVLGVEPEVVRACEGRWPRFAEEILPVGIAALRQRGVAVDVDVLGLRRLERLEYYQRLVAPLHGKVVAIVCLTRRGAVIGTLALGRAMRSFDDGELDALRELAPTLSICDAAVRAPVPLRDATALLAPLTPREREVFAHLPLGYTNAQIATALGSAERTVRNQLSSIYEKLGVGSRAEAAALSAKLGLGSQ